MHDEVQPIADAQHGDAEREQFGVGCGGVGIVDGRWTAGEDEADGLEGLDFDEGHRAGEHDGEDVLLADTAGYELGVLRAEIEDDNCLGVHVSVWQGVGRDVKTVGIDNYLRPRGRTGVEFCSGVVISMGVVEDVRQVLQDFLAPELREIRTRLDAMDEINRIRYENLSQRLELIQQSFAFDKRISNLEDDKRRSA